MFTIVVPLGTNSKYLIPKSNIVLTLPRLNRGTKMYGKNRRFGRRPKVVKVVYVRAKRNYNRKPRKRWY